MLLLLCLVPVLLPAGCGTAGFSARPGPVRAVFSVQDDRDIFDVGDRTPRDIHPRENPFLGYLKKRGLDLLDMFSFRITFGPGIRAHARVTKPLQIGLGYMGPNESKTMGSTFSVYKIGYLKREGGLWEEDTVELGIGPFYYYDTRGRRIGGNKTVFSEDDRRLWDVGAALHLLLAGAEAEVRIDEILDFVTGFFGIDLLDDDEAYRDPDIIEPVE